MGDIDFFFVFYLLAVKDKHELQGTLRNMLQQ